MNALITPHDIVLRFAKVRRAMLLHRLVASVVCGLTMLVSLLLISASVDFVFEVPAVASVGMLVITLMLSIGTVIYLINRALYQGTSRRAAAEMEQRFESIGQRLRTTLDLSMREGIDKMPLSVALARETNEECDQVDLEGIVPRRATGWWFLALAVSLVSILLPSLISPSWPIALQRTIGIALPYTTLEVTPGDSRVFAGTVVEPMISLTGRTDRVVRLQTKLADDDNATWEDVNLRDVADADAFVGSLGQIDQARLFQFVTSIGVQGPYRIDVQYPVRIETIEMTVQRPEYTGLEDRVFEKTDLTVLEGATVVCRIRTQRPVEAMDVRFSGDADIELPSVIAQKNEDATQWTFEFVAQNDLKWTVQGNDEFGTPMDPVNGIVRVKADRAPKLRWNSPAESLYVHTLAEVPMSVRVEDDYGIDEAGIRFEISGNEGYTIAQFQASESDTAPTARKVIQNVLPLEHFPLTEKDYVAYYAYAVDNHPDDPKYVESERRYIDIRQLKIDVLIRDNNNNNNNGNQNREALATLDELIGRQRYLINRSRSMRLMDAQTLGEKLGVIDRHVERQSDLGDVTREVALRLQERGNDNLDAMFQAEASMIQASDSLTLVDFESAIPQQEDAQRFLVEARTEIQRLTGRGNQRSMSGQRNRQSMLQMVRQRLSRQGTSGNQNQSQQQAAQSIANRLRTIAAAQLQIPNEIQEESPEVTAVEKQIQLLDDTTGIREEIAAMSWTSDLVPNRIDEIVEQMDRVAVDVRDEEPKIERIDQQSQSIAAKIRELALNIELVNPSNPSGRITGTRDLTASLSEFEVKLSEMADDQDRDQLEARITLQAEVVERRAETLVDVVRAVVDSDDVESQPFVEAMSLWMVDNPIVDVAQASSKQANHLRQVSPKQARVAQQARERDKRARRLRAMAQSLDELIREILEPELEMLRNLEAEGNKLAEAIESEGSASSEEVLEFAEDLDRGKLKNSAERLRSSLADQGSVRGAVRHANEHIRSRIRELILRELDADRDAPVPPEYRNAVDDYFRRVVQPSMGK